MINNNLTNDQKLYIIVVLYVELNCLLDNGIILLFRLPSLLNKI
jgi:hypothetical protein